MQRISITNPQNVIDGTAKKYYFRLRNTGGPKGDKGDKGDTGATGPQGPQGNAATVSVGSTTTLPVGYDATVTNTGSIYNAVLDFGIPQGPQGPQGAKGDKGDTGAKGDTGPRGPQGEKGTNATVYVGTTSTLAPGSQATVYNSGSDSNAVLNFGIPQGAKGDTGSQGPQGPAGQNFAPTVVAALPATGDESKLYLTPKAHTSQTATGNPITASISDGAGSMESFQLDGDTYQQTYKGKNLFNFVSRGTAQGLTTTYDATTGTITVTGKATANYSNISAVVNLSLEAGQTFTSSIDIALPVRAVTRVIYTDDAEESFNIEPGSTSVTWLPSKQVKQARLYISLTTAETSYDLSFKFQIVSGSTPDYDFEPYVGGAPSPNPDYPQAIQTVTGTQTVTIAGKNYKINLSDNELEIPDGTLTNNGVKCIMSSNSATITRTNANSNTSFIRYQLDTPITIHSGETFTLYAGNIDTIGNKTATGDYMSVRLRKSNNTDDTNTDTILGNINAKTTITATEDVTYTYFVIRTSSSLYPDNLVITPRLVIGQDNSIELCKLGTYQDYIWKDGNTWKVHKATHSLTLDGSADEGWVTTGANVFATVVEWDIDIANGPVGLCTHAKFNPVQSGVTAALANNEFAIQRNTASRGRIFFKNTAISTVNGFTAWAAANLPQIIYNAYTQTNTTITDTTLIAQLEAIRTAALENGANTISNAATGSNLAGDMEISYYGYNPTNRYDKWLWLNINNNYEQIGE